MYNYIISIDIIAWGLARIQRSMNFPVSISLSYFICDCGDKKYYRWRFTKKRITHTNNLFHTPKLYPTHQPTNYPATRLSTRIYRMTSAFFRSGIHRHA